MNEKPAPRRGAKRAEPAKKAGRVKRDEAKTPVKRASAVRKQEAVDARARQRARDRAG